MENHKLNLNQIKKEDNFPLIDIINLLNEKYKINLTENDKFELEIIYQKLGDNIGLKNFDQKKYDIKSKFNEVVDEILLEYFSTSIKLYEKLINRKVNQSLKNICFSWFQSKKKI